MLREQNENLCESNDDLHKQNIELSSKLPPGNGKVLNHLKTLKGIFDRL
jgi:hypothetical protein